MEVKMNVVLFLSGTDYTYTIGGLKNKNSDLRQNGLKMEMEEMLQHNHNCNGTKNNHSYLEKSASSVSIYIPSSKPTSYWETLTHMLKGNIGCGLLAMGIAYKNGGLLVSTLLVLFIGFLSCYNQYTLVILATKLKAQLYLENIGFSETIGTALDNGPPLIKKTANFSRILIKQFIIFTQLGFCCVYILFISQSLNQVFESYDMKLNLWIWMIITLPFIWLTALIKQLKYIAPLSTLANVSTFVALSLIIYSSLNNLPPIGDRELIGTWKQIPLCFGTIVYALEGISLTLPLQQNMKKQSQFLGATGVLNVSISFVTILIMVLGFSGYWKFGEHVRESLTLNLSATDSILTQVVIICLTIGILCTYALQFYVPVQLLIPNVKQWSSSLGFEKNRMDEFILRSVLVLFTFLLAELIPHLDLFVSLVGAVGGSFLALIFTPLADLCVRTDHGILKWRIIISMLSLIVGLCGCALGTVMSIKEIIIAVRKDFNF